MSRVLNVARILAIIILANFISGTFMVICRFKEWDITATIVTIILSVYILQIEVSNKWSCIGKEAFKNTLIVGVLLGGASAFFWFFHMIYKIGHYQGDISELLWSSPTRIIAFAISLHLTVTAQRWFTNLMLQFEEEENPLKERAIPLSPSELWSISLNIKQDNDKKSNVFNRA